MCFLRDRRLKHIAGSPGAASAADWFGLLPAAVKPWRKRDRKAASGRSW
jgi:hypothetical protein